MCGRKEILGGLALGALGATGFGLAGVGPLAGLLGSAGATAGSLGTFGSVAGAGEGFGVGFGAAGVPETGLLGGLGKFAGSKLGTNLMLNEASSLMNPQQQMPPQVQPPHQQPQPQQMSGDPYLDEMRKRGYFAAGSFFNG